MEIELTDELVSFFAKVKVDSETNCWNWTGNIQTTTGLPRFTWRGKSVYAGRFIYGVKNGQVPPRIPVNRKCENLICVNPNHAYLNTERLDVRNPNTREHAKSLLAQL